LQLPDLLKHPLALFFLCFLIGRFATAKHLGQLVEQMLLPLADQVGMHPKLARQFVDGLLFAQRLQGHPRFEVGTETASLSCHSKLLFLLFPSACSTYPTDSVFGEYYTVPFSLSKKTDRFPDDTSTDYIP
jgi:hypothetical protein